MKTSISIAFLALLATSQATKASLTMTSSRALLSSDELCSDSLFDSLESHLNDGLNEYYEDESADYSCTCTPIIASMELEIDCSTTIGDYVNNEKMTFKANADGTYELIETEWSDSDGILETYTFENGDLTSCTVDDCSCSVCDDKKTVSYTCDDDENTCNSMNPYYGAFANTFDFEDSASSKIKMTSLIVSGLLGAILLLP